MKLYKAIRFLMLSGILTVAITFLVTGLMK